MLIASTLLSSRMRRKSRSVFGARVCPFAALSPFATTFASTSQIYATSELGSVAKFRACTTPRPFTPMTATRTVSLGELVVRASPARLREVNTPRPVTAVCFTKSRRSMSLMHPSFAAHNYGALFDRANPNRPEPHDTIVILQHDLAFAPDGEPRRIRCVLALRECRIESGRAEVE